MVYAMTRGLERRTILAGLLAALVPLSEVGAKRRRKRKRRCRKNGWRCAGPKRRCCGNLTCFNGTCLSSVPLPCSAQLGDPCDAEHLCCNFLVITCDPDTLTCVHISPPEES